MSHLLKSITMGNVFDTFEGVWTHEWSDHKSKVPFPPPGRTQKQQGKGGGEEEHGISVNLGAGTHTLKTYVLLVVVQKHAEISSDISTSHKMIPLVNRYRPVDVPGTVQKLSTDQSF